MLAPLSRSARFRDQLQLDDEVNSEIADGGATGSRLPGGTSVGDLPTSSVSAVQLVPETMGSARTAPVRLWLAVLGFLALLGLPFLIKMRAVVCARRRLQHTHFVLLLGCHLPSLALCSNPILLRL